MKNMIDRILRYYGSRMELKTADGTATVCAFLQPVSGKRSIEQQLCDVGQLPQGSYLYIGPAEHPLFQDDSVLCGGFTYRVVRAEQLLVRDTAVYLWAVLKRIGGAEDAGSH